jgi:RHS repeat-associated protein
MLDAAQLGKVYEQYRYWPYGALEAVDEDHNGDDLLATIDYANDPELLSTPLGHQGLFRDHETGSIHNRGRDYDPDLSRFRQRDPNETALLLATALVRNGQAADALSGMPGSGLYADGLHLYIYQRGNPLIGTDPAGLFVYLDMLMNMGLRGDMMGMYGDVATSMVHSMKGIAALQLRRHAVLDNMLAVTAFDFSGIDQAMLLYHGLQVAMLRIGAKDLLLQLPRAVVGSVQYGARAFSKFAKRAGGRRKFLNILEGGEAGIRRFFGLADRGGFNPPRARLPLNRGGKTCGVLHLPDHPSVPLTSGVKGPSQGVRGQGLPGFNGVQITHVEGHAAAHMRATGSMDGVLDINKAPCTAGSGRGCRGLLPRMLPEGARLRVRYPGGEAVFIGFPIRRRCTMSEQYIMSWTDWERTEERVANDLEAIQQLIRSLSNECNPPMLLLIWEKGAQRELSVGLGRPQTVFGYQESVDPPYFISIGDRNAEGEEWFCCGNERSYFLMSNLVSNNLIMPTVQAFVEESCRPRTVAWERL